MGFLFLIIVFAGLTVGAILLLNMGKEQKEQPVQVTSYQRDDDSSIYKIPRNRLLNLLGWAEAPQRYFIGEHSITFDVLKGYTYKDIVGTFYRPDVTLFDVGWFNGYAAIEPSNSYDGFAVAIYRDDHKQIGYIPKGNVALFNYIRAQGGYVHAYGALAYDCWSNRWYGLVAIEDDASMVEVRNAPIREANITFYEPTIDITKFLNEKQDN